jgi:radical SAM protein with 4Fe4S-binding SPASM domain
MGAKIASLLDLRKNERKPLQDLLPLEQPLRVMIDPCDACNLRCNFCFQSHVDFKGSMMDEATFDIILEQLKDFKNPLKVYLYGYGEPLLNPLLPKFVRKLSALKGIGEITVYSNGVALTHELGEELIAAGLNKMEISLNGVSDESFKRITNTPVSFEKVYEQLRYFSENRKSCYLHVKINGEEYSDDEQKLFAELFSSVGDSIYINHTVNIWSGIELETASDNALLGQKMINHTERKVCPEMFYQLSIHPDGSVSTCGVDYTYRTQNMGNIKEKTLRELWNGTAWNDIRIKELKQQKNGYSICDGCNFPQYGSTADITPYRNDILKKME